MFGSAENYALVDTDRWWNSNMFICISCLFDTLRMCCACSLLSTSFGLFQAEICLCPCSLPRCYSLLAYSFLHPLCVFICSTTQRIRASSVRSGSGTFWRPTALSLTRTNWRSYWPSLMATPTERSATKTLSTWWDVFTFYRLVDISVQHLMGTSKSVICLYINV